MATRKYFPIHIDVGSTPPPASPTQVTSKSCYITSVVISCFNAGAGSPSPDWLLHIRDGAGKILIPPFILSVPTDGLPNVNVSFDEPQVMRGGVYIVWSGTPGIADIRISCNVTEEG